MAPLAPHVCEEIWAKLGNQKSLTREPWPTYDPACVQLDEVLVVVQINGKLKDRLTVARDLPENNLKELVLRAPGVVEKLQGQTPKKVIVVPNKLVNIVV